MTTFLNTIVITIISLTCLSQAKLLYEQPTGNDSVSVDRGSYMIGERIGESVSIAPKSKHKLTAAQQALHRDWQITFYANYTLDLPALIVSGSESNAESKELVSVSFTVDVECDQSVDVKVFRDQIARTTNTRIRLEQPDPQTATQKIEPWLEVKLFNREIGEATGLDGTIYVYTPGKGFEPKAK